MELPKEARDAIKKTYRAMDENGDGRVSVAEVRRASKRIGIEFSMDQIKQMMGELDDNGDGYINYPEFERMITEFIHEDTEEVNAARKIFQSMDVDGDGKVTIPEIVSSLKVSKAEAKELLEEADTNKDGKMSFEGIMVQNLNSLPNTSKQTKRRQLSNEIAKKLQRDIRVTDARLGGTKQSLLAATRV